MADRLVSASIDSGMASDSSSPGLGCDQYSEKRPLSLLPTAAWSTKAASLLSRALGRNTRYRPSRSGFLPRALRACSVRSWRRLSLPWAFKNITNCATPSPYKYASRK
ncbi:hypothetical protein D3C76_1088590 [compost metagenome]